MTRVCCYCKRVLGEKEPLEDKRVTHGCCEECQRRVLAEHEQACLEAEEVGQ